MEILNSPMGIFFTGTFIVLFTWLLFRHFNPSKEKQIRQDRESLETTMNVLSDMRAAILRERERAQKLTNPNNKEQVINALDYLDDEVGSAIHIVRRTWENTNDLPPFLNPPLPPTNKK